MTTNLYLRDTPAPYQGLPLDISSLNNSMSKDMSIWWQMATELGHSETSVSTQASPTGSASHLGKMGGWQSPPIQAQYITGGSWFLFLGAASLALDRSNPSFPSINFALYILRQNVATNIANAALTAASTQLPILGLEYFFKLTFTLRSAFSLPLGDVQFIDGDVLLFTMSWVGNDGQTQVFWNGQSLKDVSGVQASDVSSCIQIPANLVFLKQ